jgi:septum formation protein
LLKEAGIEVLVVAPNVDETMNLALPVDQRVLDIARKKANMVQLKYPNDVIIAADTVVVLGNDVLGKPASKEEARHMLSLLSGTTHEVKTAVVLLGQTSTELVETSKVTFRTLSNEDIDLYMTSGEWQDKAGAYAIQGEAGKFVTNLQGSFTNVMGLPIEHIKGLL